MVGGQQRLPFQAVSCYSILLFHRAIEEVNSNKNIFISIVFFTNLHCCEADLWKMQGKCQWHKIETPRGTFSFSEWTKRPHSLKCSSFVLWNRFETTGGEEGLTATLHHLVAELIQSTSQTSAWSPHEDFGRIQLSLFEMQPYFLCVPPFLHKRVTLTVKPQMVEP